MRMGPTEELMLAAAPMALIGLVIAGLLVGGVLAALAVAAPPLIAYGLVVRTRQLWRWIRGVRP
jgi:hypothetical protein